MNFCNQKIALFPVEHALTKYFILQNNFHFSLTNEQRAVLNCTSLGHRLAGIKLLIQNINMRHVLILHDCHYHTWCLTSATPECNVRSEKSVTMPSRLNAPIVLRWLNNLTLPALVGLKLLTWRLASAAGLLLTRLTSAMYCPLRWRFRTFEMGILAMWMMENVHYLAK